jgi:ABC-type antimicrobial peptide transport system permease subunit
MSQSKKIPQPPKWIDCFLHWRLPEDQFEEVQGDMHELYGKWVKEVGVRKARWLYLLNGLTFLRPLPKRKSTFQRQTLYILQPHPINMIANYFKIAYRNLSRQKGYSFINISGLAVGMTVAMVIGLWMYDELSFNTYHQNYDRIAQLMQNQTFDGEIRTGSSQALELAPEVRNKYGNNFTYIVSSSWNGEHLLSVGDKVLSQSGNFMEPGAPHMLTLEMLKGTRSGLQDLASILLSESVAKAFFGDGEPVGQLMKINNKMDVKVTGVYADIPSNSSFSDLGFIAPWDLFIKSEDYEKKLGWGNSWFQVFAQIAPNTDMKKVSSTIKNVKMNAIAQDEGEVKFKPEIFLHPMSHWHLYSEFENGVNVGGRIEYVWLFGTIGVFVLLLACINFMNLSTARSERRAKEVGVRKAVGSLRSQLVIQFLSESLLVTGLSFVISILLAMLLLPYFNGIADKKLTILWREPLFWLAGMLFSVGTGILAGSYPALYLSSFNPVKALKGTFRVGRFASIPRKALVVVQFTVSVTLIIGTIIIFQQIQFAKNRPIGYNRNGIITIPMKTEEMRKNYEVFRTDLLESGAVEGVAQSQTTVTNGGVTNSGLQWKGKNPAMQDEFITVSITHDFGKVVSWKLKQGRDFSKTFATDSLGFILNETAVKYMGLENPIGETVKAFGKTFTVIGVVKDMVMQSLYEPVRPNIFYIDTFNRVRFINVKLHPQKSAAEALASIETIFKKYNRATPFEYKFADEEFAAKYRSEERIGTLSSIFAFLAIFISCLGLYGLASFMAERRTKEVSIRKILGASVVNLWGLLSKDFVYLVLISLLIATPIAYYFLSGWLENYEYRTSISPWIFILTGLAALVITLITVSFQAIKAALTNPVKSLRNE